MAKLRKMWIDMNEEIILSLMELMKTQSKETLATFGINYVREIYLPLYLKHNEDQELLTTFTLVENWIIHPKEKVDLKELRKKASTIKDQNMQIQYRAIITAFAIMSTPTNVLGFLLYGCMAYAYSFSCKTQEEYDKLALNDLHRAYEYLKGMAISNEVHPVKLNFNC